jgi:hypothetical protein
MTVISPGSLKWVDLQKKQLARYTSGFQHVFHLNNVDPDEFSGEVVSHQKTNATQGNQHVQGLNKLIDYARLNANQYRGFLILDSDCWPIKAWEKGFSGVAAASVVRAENLDTFFHPCAVYVRDIQNVSASMKDGVNLAGEPTQDVVMSFSVPTMPLMRTNKVNIHPVLAGIYYSCFYHHGTGSRPYDVRSCREYYNEGDNEYLQQIVFEKPESLMRLLDEGIDIRDAI